MELLRNFRELSKSDVGLAGGKGASLGEMTEAGIPVPPGFVILASSFEKFIEETELSAEIDTILHSVNHEEIHTVEAASEKIQALILAADMPKDIRREIVASFKKLGAKYVAVRSSATAEDSSAAAWAGQLDSFLNTTEAKLLENVKRCWASLFTPRAIFYRFEKKLHAQKISVAVVVQKMVESEVSGIAFSVHPVTQDRNQLIIEASYGLGEAIVSGQVTPDCYVVEKAPRRIIERTVQAKARGLYRLPKGENEWKEITGAKAEAQALSDAQILKLSELILHIERHYGFPCDIEWALEKGKFYIVQSRPITTLMEETSPSEQSLPTSGADVTSEIDWERSLERKQSFLLASIFLDIYTTDLREIAGARFEHQMVIYKNGFALYLRSAKEVTKALKGPLLALADNPANIKKIAKVGIATPQHAKNLVERTHKMLGNKKTKNFGLLYQEYRHILLYQILLPYWIMGAINILDPKKRIYYKKTIKHLEPFRNMGDAKLLEEKFLGSLLDFLSGDRKISHDLLRYLTGKEFIDLLNGQDDNGIREVLRQRKSAAFSYWQDGENDDHFDFSERYLSLGSHFENGEHGVWYGKAAFPGKVSGRVKIVETPSDRKKFNRGDVLVSLSTNPALTSIFGLAAAIVSDEGGIMSHAAIVSREMKKPCVIGVENASKILKDGDMVEVDANKGMVRILNDDSTGAVASPSSAKLFKFMTREHSFFYASIWNEADRDYFDKYVPGTNFRNMAFLRDAHGVVDIYFDSNELEDVFKKISRAIIADPKLLDAIIQGFDRHWKKLWPYVSKKKKIKNLKELAEYYNDCVQWWVPMAYIFSIPDQEEIPEPLRAKALKVRKASQEYSSDIDHVYMNFFKKKYPRYAVLAGLLMPEEVYRIEKLTAKELKAIKERQQGWALETKDGRSELKPLGEVRSIPIAFSKIYTRDTTYIMQELWAIGCSQGVEKEFGWRDPYLPGMVHYMNQGSIEIWENLRATEWLEDQILKKNIEDSAFIDVILKKYRAKLKIIHGLWKKKRLGINALDELIKLSDEAMPYFIFYYYSAVNEKTPAKIRAKALEMRNSDEFFAQNDIVIRDSIATIHPRMKNYETTVLINELKKIPGNKLLAERKLHSLIIDGRDLFIGTPADFEKFHHEYSFEKEIVSGDSSGTIIGEIAQKGKVTGPVKILRRRDQIDEVKEGDVIVSPMTTPDFLPAMRRAAAFVTDEGGITCHAGIVARELKKPCIIGTKIATQVLKDGDMVEVDANRGMVKLLKKTKRVVGGASPKNIWHHWGRWPENVLSNSLWLVFDRKVNKKLGTIITRIRDLDGNYFLFESDLDGLDDFVEDKIKNDYGWFDRFFSAADESALHLLALENKRVLAKVLRNSISCLSFSKSMELLDYGLQKYIKDGLGKDPMALFQEAPAYRLTHLMKYERDLRSLKQKQNIHLFLKKHAWIGTHGFAGKPLSKEKVLEDINENRNDIPKTSQNKNKLLILIAKLSYYRSYLVETVDRVTFSYWGALEKLATKHGLKREDILLLTFEEVIELEKHGKLPKDYRERRKKFGIINETGAGKMKVVTGERLEVLLKESLGEQGETQKIEILEGSVAYPGKVIGVVKVMGSARDISKLKKGEILVSTETTPDYIQGMKIAGAIVTNQGGVTSHAAIVSRELKKPCVVGTKIATQALKDGDMVEVDANKGIVKILKRK
jgi:phosphoenolpyruvate synthase/pyruvate phosphate dikinase